MINSMEPLSCENPDLTSSVIFIKKNWICRLLNLYPADSLDFVIAIYISSGLGRWT